MALPVLVGGIALRDRDLVPCIAYATVYGLLTCGFVYRLVKKDSRTTITLGFMAFVLERTISFSLRSAVSYSPNTESPGLTEYMQATFGIAFIVLLQDLAKFHRFLLVSTTLPAKSVDTKQNNSSETLTEDIIQDDNQARARSFYRRVDAFSGLVTLTATVCGAIACESVVRTGTRSVHWARLRYASTILALLANLCMIGLFVSSMKKRAFPDITQKAAYLLLSLNCLLLSPAIYRLVVMKDTTDNYYDPFSAMNSSRSKAYFYIFHHLPETITCILMLSINVKDVYKIGLYGDTPPKPWRKKKEQKACDDKCNSLV